MKKLLKRKLLNLIAGLGLLTLPTLGASSRPNIVLILADDMGFSDLGCYGGEIRTPNLDALAAGGLRFTQFYNTARCCPTRASLLTGLYPHQAGMGFMSDPAGYSSGNWINDWYRGDLRPDTMTIAEALKPVGYRSYAVGKWHVTKEMEGKSKHNWPLQRGFDRYYGIIPGAANYFTPGRLTRDNTTIQFDADPDYHPARYYLTDAIADNAVRYVNDHTKQNTGQPFFLYVAFTAAHWPLHALPEDIARYKGKYDDGYEPIRQARFTRAKKFGVIDPQWDLSAQVGDWSAMPRKDWEARCMEVYAAQVDRMDQNVGKIVAALRSAGQLDNTLIFFLQDNGACAEPVGRNAKKGSAPPPMPGGKETFLAYGAAWANVSNTPFRYYKHFVHEGGISTPLIVHWPAFIKRHGDLEHQPGHLIDIMATCVDVAGATYPARHHGLQIQPLEGCSLTPAFSARPIQRDAIFWEHEGNRALRVENWKLVAKGAAGPWELYDMSLDRTEMHDLAVRQPERLKSMSSLWDQWARRTHAIPWPWKPPYGEIPAHNSSPPVRQ
jgi:arylsulfatase